MKFNLKYSIFALAPQEERNKKRLKNIVRYLKIKKKENNGFLDSKKFIDVLEKHNRNVFKKTGNKIVEVRK